MAIAQRPLYCTSWVTFFAVLMLENLFSLSRYRIAAFVTIYHSVLLDRLSVDAGVTGSAYLWFREYLVISAWHGQRVMVNLADLWCAPRVCFRPSFVFTVHSTVEQDRWRVQHWWRTLRMMVVCMTPSIQTRPRLSKLCTNFQNCCLEIQAWMSSIKLNCDYEKRGHSLWTKNTTIKRLGR